MGDWDDDDFEVDVKQLDERKFNIVEENVEIEPIKEASVVNFARDFDQFVTEKKKVERKKSHQPLNTFTNDLNKELTEEEKEQLQMRSDLLLAKELFGVDAKEPLRYNELESLDEFRSFGEEIGNMLVTRSNATHYIEMVQSLMKVIVSSLDANKARYLNTSIKTIVDEKSVLEKTTKVKGASAKPTVKLTQKSVPHSKARKDLYEDYVVGEYDDYEDNFM